MVNMKKRATKKDTTKVDAGFDSIVVGLIAIDGLAAFGWSISDSRLKCR